MATREDADPLEVIDSRSSRIRRSLDLVRLSGLFIGCLALAGLGTIGGDTSRGANDDVSRLLSEVPHIFIRLFSALGSTGALAVPIAFIVRELVRNQSRRLIEALVTGVVAIGIIEGLDRLIKSDHTIALHDALVRIGANSHVQPLDAYLAALFAFVAVVGVSGDPRWRVLLVAITALYIVSAFTATQASVLSMLLSLMIGATIGVAERCLLGSVNEAPGAAAIATELRRRDIHLVRMERVPAHIGDHRTYLCLTNEGRGALVQAFDRDLIATGAVRSFYRLVRLRSEIASVPALSLERIAEHRSLLAMAAASAAVPTPALLAGVPCGPDTVVLAYDLPPSTPFTDPTDAQLDELWNYVERLHEHRVTHHGLMPERLSLDLDGHVILPILSEGSVFATDLRLSLDRIQLLVTTAALVGPDRAVRSARTALTQGELADALPLLQPIALARPARTIATRDKGLLEALRAQIQEPEPDTELEVVNLERVRPRTVIAIAAVLVAAYLLIGQYGSVDLATVFAHARWQWLPLVAVTSALTYVAAAVSLTGYVQEKLPFGRTVLTQVAASFVGFLTPPAVGGLAINIRYLRKSNVSTTGAATSVGVSQVVNAMSHVVLLIAFAAATGASAHHSLPIPGWAFIALGALAVLALLVLAIPPARRWLLAKALPPLREALPRLLNLLTSPVKLLESVGGAVALNVFYILALWSSAHAFDSHVGLAQVAVVYLAGAALGAAAPTPGGLGAVEIAMSTGLTAVGMQSTAAVSAVLLFRLATFILPVPIGWVAMQWLQRHDAL